MVDGLESSFKHGTGADAVTPAVMRDSDPQPHLIEAAWGDRFKQPQGPDPQLEQYLSRQAPAAMAGGDFRSVLKDAFPKVLSGQVLSYDATQFQLAETAPAFASQVTKWELMTDQQLAERRTKLGNRDLLPVYNTGTGKADADNLYAVGYGADGLPVDVQQYYRDKQTGGIHYQRQFTIKYGDEVDPQTKAKTGYTQEVTEYVSNTQPHDLGPTRMLGSANTEVGRTIWHARLPDNKFQYAELQDGATMLNNPLDVAPANMNPLLVLDLSGQTAVVYRRNSNLQMVKTEKPAPSADADRLINSIGQQLYFFDLFGPNGQFRP